MLTSPPRQPPSPPLRQADVGRVTGCYRDGIAPIQPLLLGSPA